MGYKTDVRIVTTTSGYKEMLKNSEVVKLMKSIDVNKKSANIVYLGWNQINVEGLKILQKSLLKLVEMDFSYRVTKIGENLEDIEDYWNISDKDRKKGTYLFYPTVTRVFDENDIDNQLKAYSNYYNKYIQDEMEVD